MSSTNHTQTKDDHVSLEVPQEKPSQARDLQNDFNFQIRCPSCFNEIQEEEILAPLMCKHKFCKNCVTEYIEIKIKIFQIPNIRCLQEGCTEIFTDNQIKQILDNEKYVKYQEFVLKKMINRNSSGKLCPNPGCARLIKQINKDNSPYVSCMCGTQICKQCLSFSHIGKTCLQNLDPEFETFALENDIRFCMMCKTAVSQEGCHSVVCCVCDYQWCWICGRSNRYGHICAKYWNPYSPYIYENPRKPRNFKKTLASPFVVIYFLIFWSWAYFDPTLFERGNPVPNPSTLKKTGYFILSGFIGLVLLPITVFLVIGKLLWSLWKMIKDSKRNKLAAEIYQKDLKRLNRWMTGDSKLFMYKDFGKP